jgi:nitrogen fixation/metabolism regulation signal transduction histidine kinase
MHFIGLVILFFVLLAVIVNIFYTKMILKPIKHLTDCADAISLGRLETQINTSGDDEIAKLAKAFERMKTSIKMAFEQLAR